MLTGDSFLAKMPALLIKPTDCISDAEDYIPRNIDKLEKDDDDDDQRRDDREAILFPLSPPRMGLDRTDLQPDDKWISQILELYGRS